MSENQKSKSGKKSKKKRIIIAVAVVILLVVVVVAALNQNKTETIAVEIEKVARQKVVHKVNASGKIQPETEIKISANISAYITEITVEQGDYVEKGQHLISLDETQYRALFEQAQSSVRSATARLKQVEAQKSRVAALFGQKLVSSQEMESVEAEYELAQSQLEQAQAALRTREDELAKTRLLAPNAGLVTLINKEVGEMALGSMFQADVLMMVADLSRMEVVVDVNENDVVSVTMNDTVEIEIDAFQDTMFYGIVSEIAHVAQTSGLGTQEQVTNFEVRVSMLEVPDRIRPGMSATADIITDVRKDVLAVPIQSLTVRREGWEEQPVKKSGRRGGRGADRPDPDPADSVKQPPIDENIPAEKKEMVEVLFTVSDEPAFELKGKRPKEVRYAHIRQVQVGISSDTHYEIISGLEEGEEIVTGSYRAISRDLKHNSAVEVGSDEQRRGGGRRRSR